MATVVLLYTGAVRVDEGTITQGQVVALVNYMSQILVELVKLANLIITITKAWACANRIQSVFEIKSSMAWEQKLPGTHLACQNTDADKAGKDEADQIIFDHVHLAYAGAGAESLTDIDFRVKKGQTVCLIEAMKTMIEVPAPQDCVIETVLKANGELASFGEALMRCRPC